MSVPKNHALVVQEVYAWLLGHWSIRVLMQQGCDRCRYSTITSKFYRDITSHPLKSYSKVSTLTTRRITPFFDWLTVEILDTLLPERVHRNNPRVIKKTVSKFRFKKPKHRGTGQPVEAPKFHITN